MIPTALGRRLGRATGRLAVVVMLMVMLAACGSGGAATHASGMGPGMMAQGNAPRMMGRGQGVPPPTVTIAPTAAATGSYAVSFSHDVLPILTSQCATCHGGQGGLWADSYEHLMVGGTSGKVIIPGKPDKSLLYRRISGSKQPRMPLNGQPLSQSQIAAIRGWIAEGAPKN